MIGCHKIQFCYMSCKAMEFSSRRSCHSTKFQAFEDQSCSKYSTNKYQYQYQYQWSKYQYLTFKYQ